MTDILKKGDFVELEYDGKLKAENIIFDTTNEDTAKKHGLHNPQAVYGKVVICIGENQVLPGVDKALEGKETEKEYDIEISAEQGFGKKRADLLKIVPTNVFKKQNIKPVPGLQLNIDGRLGTIRTVTGGRTIVDFNHPLSGRDLSYHLKVGKKITDKKAQLVNYLSLGLNMKKESLEVNVEGDKASITFPAELPEPMKKQLGDKIKQVIALKNVEFKAKKAAKPAES